MYYIPISSHWRVICTQKCWCPTGNDLCPQGAPPVAASWRRLWFYVCRTCSMPDIFNFVV